MTLWDQFIQERLYLKGVAPETLRYYRWVHRAFLPALDAPTKTGMLACIQKLLSDGVSPVSVNTYLRGFKAYILWLKAENKLTDAFKIQFLKTEQKVLQTFSEVQIQALIHFKPKGVNMVRAHMVVVLILDSGLRITEALSIAKTDVDLENLLIRVKGKGNKHRIVPMSLELRRILYRYMLNQKSAFLFATRTGTKITNRNFLRDFKQLCKELGITGVRCSAHTLRHTFAVNYLRAGGNIYYLSRILGHSSVKTTEVYLRSLGIVDLQAVHNELSLLTPLNLRCLIKNTLNC